MKYFKHIFLIRQLNFLIWLLLFAPILKAQEYRIFSYDNDNGLHNNLTKAIAQDSLGFIWVATDDGLARFDGFNFRIFNQQLPSNYIKALFLRKNKQLIAVTDMGVVEIVSKVDTAYFVPLINGSNKETDTTIGHPKTVFETDDGSLWFSRFKIIYRYKNKKIRKYYFDDKNKTSSYFRAFSMVEDSLGNVFAFSQQGFLHKYDAQNDSFFELKSVGQIPLVNSAVCVKTGEIIIATENGLTVFKYDKSLHYSVTTILPGINFNCIAVDSYQTIFAGSQTNEIYNIYKHKESYQFEKIPNLPEKPLKNIFFDKEDNIWLSTDAGIIFMNALFFASTIKDFDKLFINDVEKDSKNTIYVSNGNSVYNLIYENSRLKANLLLKKEKETIFQFLPFDDKFLCSSSFGKLEWLTKNTKINIPNPNYRNDIFFIKKDKFGSFWLCLRNTDGVGKLSTDNTIIHYNNEHGKLTNTIISLAEDSIGTLYGGASTDTAYLFRYDRKNDAFKNISIPMKFEHDKNLFVNDIVISGKTIYLATSTGLLKIDDNKISRVQLNEFENQNAKSLEMDKTNNLWIGFDNGVIKYNKSAIIHFDKTDGLPVNSITYRNIIVDGNNNIFFGTTSGLAYSFKNNMPEKITPTPIITSVQFNGIESSKTTSVYENSYCTIRFATLSYPAKDIKYQTKIVETGSKWSGEKYNNELFISKLKAGKYTMYVRAQQHGNYLWSQPAIFTFKVKPNWYNTWWSYILYFLLFSTLVYTLVKIYTRRLVMQKDYLEHIVSLRTEEINMKNEELLQQNEEMTSQRDLLARQKNSITDSINYAQTIQQAILPPIKIIKEIFPQHFVLWYPLDIVSGDFYFWRYISGTFVIAAADCTGHGVPGAFMSMLGITLLNEIVLRREITQADEILNVLRIEIKYALGQSGKIEERTDGMDIALCTIDLETLEMTFAGAFNPFCYFRNNEFIKINSDRQPVGIYTIETPFNAHKIQLQAGDIFYIFSDGYYSQFGGPKPETLRPRRFIEILTEIHHLPMDVQKNILEQKFNEWKGNNLQTDDVLVLGVRI